MGERALIRASVAVLAGCSVVLSGCAETIRGNAERHPDVDPASTVILQPGNYPTKPAPPLGPAGPEGRLVEARRMAEYLVQPFQVDLELISGDGGPHQNGVIKNADATLKAFPKPVPEGANHNLISGITVIRDNEGQQQKSIQNTLLRFATPEDAAAAVEDMTAKSASISWPFDDDARPTEPIPIPRYPDTRAVWDTSSRMFSVLAYTARGPFVMAQATLSASGIEAATELVAATLDKQIPLLDTFQPTPVDQLAALPLDPDGILARTLPPPPEDSSVSAGMYGPQGFLIYSTDPPGDEKLFREAGVTAVARWGATVYAARDNDGAKHVVSGFTTYMREVQGFEPFDAVPGLTDSVCMRVPQKTFGDNPARYSYVCVAAADRYVVEVHSGQPAAAHQQTAAQYLLLTAK